MKRRFKIIHRISDTSSGSSSDSADKKVEVIEYRNESFGDPTSQKQTQAESEDETSDKEIPDEFMETALHPRIYWSVPRYTGSMMPSIKPDSDDIKPRSQSLPYSAEFYESETQSSLDELISWSPGQTKPASDQELRGQEKREDEADPVRHGGMVLHGSYAGLLTLEDLRQQLNRQVKPGSMNISQKNSTMPLYDQRATFERFEIPDPAFPLGLLSSCSLPKDQGPTPSPLTDPYYSQKYSPFSPRALKTKPEEREEMAGIYSRAEGARVSSLTEDFQEKLKFTQGTSSTFKHHPCITVYASNHNQALLPLIANISKAVKRDTPMVILQKTRTIIIPSLQKIRGQEKRKANCPSILDYRRHLTSYQDPELPDDLSLQYTRHLKPDDTNMEQKRSALIHHQHPQFSAPTPEHINTETQEEAASGSGSLHVSGTEPVLYEDPGPDQNILETDLPILAELLSDTTSLPSSSDVQFCSTDSCWTRRTSSSVPGSVSMPSLNHITSAGNNKKTRAASLPDIIDRQNSPPRIRKSISAETCNEPDYCNCARDYMELYLSSEYSCFTYNFVSEDNYSDSESDYVNSCWLSPSEARVVSGPVELQTEDLMEIEESVGAVNYPVTSILPTHQLHISSSGPGGSPRGSSSVPGSVSMPSLNHITSAGNNKSTRAASLPDLKLQSSFEEFTPDVSEDDEDHEGYRFQCSCPGLYQCSVTGLVFDMEGEGDVLYRTVPWNRRILVQHHKKPAGPLFDIKCQQQSVRQLHLPHCQILPTAGFLEVAHVKDDGVEFITPQKITETHLVINIRGFSGFGNVNDEDSPPDPIRALVLLFYRPPDDPDVTSELSVLLLPRNIVIRDLQRTRRKLFGDERFINVSPHCKLVPDQVYTLSTEPEDDLIKVQPTEAEFDEDSYDNYFPSIVVSLKTLIRDVNLSLKDKTTSCCVWERDVCLLPSRAKTLTLPPKEKLLNIWSSFINRTSESVLNDLLDKLLEKKVFNYTEREKAHEKQIRRDKADFIIDTVRKKGDAASSEMIKFFCELDPFLSRDLELNSVQNDEMEQGGDANHL